MEEKMKNAMIVLLFSLLLSASSIAADESYAKGLLLYKKGNYSASIKHFTEYIGRTPDPRAYYLLGYANYKLKKYESARKYFRDAYLLYPDFQPALIDMR